MSKAEEFEKLVQAVEGHNECICAKHVHASEDLVDWVEFNADDIARALRLAAIVENPSDADVEAIVASISPMWHSAPAGMVMAAILGLGERARSEGEK